MFVEGESRPVHSGTSVSNPGSSTWTEFDTEDVKNHLWKYFRASLEELVDNRKNNSLPLFKRLHQQCGFRRLLFTIRLQMFRSTFIARFLQLLRWLFVFSIQSKNSRFGKCHSGKNSSAISWTRTGSGIVLPAISVTAVVGYFNDKPRKQPRLKSKLKDWIFGKFWNVILFHVILKPMGKVNPRECTELFSISGLA